VQEHPEVPTTNIPIDPALVAKIDRLTQQGRDVLRAAAELASSVGHVMERMDEIKATTCYGDDDAINALCRVTGWDTLLDTMMAIAYHAEAGADDCPTDPPAWYARLLDKRRERWEGVA
jgi:hypothetical protein